MRAVAVTAVILYHLGARWLPGGFLGVDLFFVLSGYLITDLLLTAQERDGRVDVFEFWARRARRLLPALLLVLGAVALAVRQWEPAGAWAAHQNHLLSSLFYYANWYMILDQQSYFDAVAVPSALRHMWSLAIEEQFYLVWPLALVVLTSRGRLRRGGGFVLGALVAASAIAMVLSYSPDLPVRAYAGTDTRVQQLLIGALLTLCVRRYRVGGRWPGAAAWVAAAASVGLLIVVSDSGFYFHGGATVVALVFAALIWAIEQAPNGAVARALSIRPVAWLGTISYGIYLWHLPVIRFAPEALPFDLSPPAAPLAIVTITVCFATASYYLVERPIREGRRLRLALRTPGQTAGWAVSAVSACVVVMVISTSWTTGLQDEQIAAQAGFAADAERAAGAEAGIVAGGQPVADQLCPDTTSICVRLPPRPGQRTIALVGDSIARSLDPGVYALARRKGWGYVVAAHNGCGLTGLMNVDGERPKPFMEQCARETPTRIRRLLDEFHPDLVISYSRWELVAHRNPAGDIAAPMSPQWTVDVHAGLRTFAETVRGAGAALAMLAVLPNSPAGAGCLSAPAAAKCSAAPDPLTVATNDIYKRIRDEVPGAGLMFAQDVVCPSERCRPVVDGLLLRFDGLHFTPEGARWLVERLEPQLP